MTCRHLVRPLLVRACRWGGWLALGSPLAIFALSASEPVRELGGRRELLADRFLVEELENGARLELQHPRSAGVVLRMDQPWEGRYSTYVTVLHDRGRYRLYYRGRADLPPIGDPATVDQDLMYQVTCYAESADGISWHKPQLGLFEVNGSRANNVVLANNLACANFTPFIDERPGVPQEERYKALGGVHERGLELFVSPDGLRWRAVRRLENLKGAFDSQNVAFWSEAENCYVLYFRTWSSGIAYQGQREISRTTSPDLVHWSAAERMTFGDAPNEQLYTQQTQPYFRAPHLYVALPNRFLPDRRVLSDEEFVDAGIWERSRTSGINDGVFMTSRGGSEYDRTFLSAFVRPGLDRQNWSPRNNYAAHGVVQTSPTELSLYYTRHYAQPTNHLERFVLRLDGFASVAADRPGGFARTHPLTFSGAQLSLNYATSAAGKVLVALCNAEGVPFPGYALSDCDPLVGDEIQRTVSWGGRSDVSAFAGQTVRLRFELEDADIFSLQFQPSVDLP